MRLPAALLAFLTLAAVVFGGLNFRQRSQFAMPDDGVAWLDAPSGVQAWRIKPASPAARAGIQPGDIVSAVDGVPVQRATQVTEQLSRAGIWSSVPYQLTRNGVSFQANVLTAPAEKPTLIWNCFGILSVLYLFIGAFIFSPPLDCTAGCTFLHLLSGIFHFLRIPLQR